MSRTQIEARSHKVTRPTTVGSAIRSLTLTLAILTTGLIAGVYYAFEVSVNLGLAEQPDASYIATMNAINERIENPLFFFSFFGAALFLLAALVAHYPRRPRSGRFWLVAVASVLYIGGSFLLTVFVNVPMNNQLAAVDPDAPARVLARARNAYEGPWDFWNGVRAVCSTLAFLPAARGARSAAWRQSAMTPGTPVAVVLRRCSAIRRQLIDTDPKAAVVRSLSGMGLVLTAGFLAKTGVQARSCLGSDGSDRS